MITDERKQLIENFDEVKSYFFIDGIGAFIWRMNHEASHGRVNMTPDIQEGMSNMYEEQVYCAKQLIKFGVNSDSVNDRENGDYWKWYGHWKNWHEGMSDEQWEEVDKRLNKDEDISEFLPKNKWNETPAV